MDALTFDQCLVFASVVETGSFSAAARRLNRAQSAITYAVQKLEDQIGTALFDRSTYRPTLSEAGRVLLPHARRILDDVGRLRSVAREIARGLEAEVRLSIGAMIPLAMITPALRAFARAYPTVRLRIAVEPFSLDIGRPAPAVEAADIRILFGLAVPRDFEARVFGTITLVDVAAPGHPLAALPGPLGADTLRDHLQIVLTERREAVAGNDLGVAALNTWRVTDLAAKHALLLSGVGWGSLPDALVREDLAAGRLVRLPVQDATANAPLRRIAVVAAHRQAEPLGPAGRWLLQRLTEAQSDRPALPTPANGRS